MLDKKTAYIKEKVSYIDGYGRLHMCAVLYCPFVFFVFDVILLMLNVD